MEDVYKTESELPQMKNTIYEMKKKLDSINRRLEIAEETIMELENNRNQPKWNKEGKILKKKEENSFYKTSSSLICVESQNEKR